MSQPLFFWLESLEDIMRRSNFASFAACLLIRNRSRVVTVDGGSGTYFSASDVAERPRGLQPRAGILTRRVSEG